jgi:hypothetical protein
MHGDERLQGEMFSYISLEAWVPSDHLLREIRRLSDEVLHSLGAEFDTPPKPEVCNRVFASPAAYRTGAKRSRCNPNLD